MARTTHKRRCSTQMRYGRRDTFKTKVRDKLTAVSEFVPEVINHSWFEAFDRKTVAKRHVREVECFGKRFEKLVGVVRLFPRCRTSRCPYKTATAQRSEVRPNLGIQPPANPTHGNHETEPNRFTPVTFGAGHVTVIVGNGP